MATDFIEDPYFEEVMFQLQLFMKHLVYFLLVTLSIGTWSFSRIQFQRVVEFDSFLLSLLFEIYYDSV